MPALTTESLKSLLTFPFKDPTWKNKLLIGSLLYFGGFILPVIPWIFITGYAYEIMQRQTRERGEPTLPEWDDWGRLGVNGLKLAVISLIYLIPITIFMVCFFVLIFGTAILTGNNQDSALVLLPILGQFFLFAMVAIVFLVLGIFMPVVSVHLAYKGDINAIVDLNGWGPIFRANWGGFLIAYIIVMVLGIAVSMVTQIFVFTIVLICLLPLILAPVVLYISLVRSVLYAQAYNEGRDRIEQYRTV